MVKVGKEDTFKKYYQLNNMKNEIKKTKRYKKIVIRYQLTSPSRYVGHSKKVLIS